MSHLTCTSLPRKHNVPKSSSNYSMCKAKSSSHTGGVNTAPYSSMKTAHNSSPLKVKRLKTRKERNKIRDQERSHTCPQHSKNVGSEKAQHHGGRHSHLVVSSRKEKTFAKPFLTQKPSIITEGRLTSIRGLFSHEVRSIDIERVVSEQLKKEKQIKDQRKRSMMDTSPLPPQPPSMPDSDRECILDEVQEPEKPMRRSRKEPTRKYTNVSQTNKEVTLPKEASRQDEKHSRRANTGNKDSPSSLKGTYELMDLSSPENKLTHRFCSTPNEANKKNFDFPEIDSPITHNENNKTDIIDERNDVMIRLESTSAIDGFPNMDVPQSKTDPFLSEFDSWTSTLTDEERKQISMSVKEAVNKLSAHLELHMPRRPLLAECRNVLLRALHKTHSFHLQHNLHELQSLFDGKQTTSFDAEHMLEDRSQIHFSHALENEESSYSRNTHLWTENAIQHDYIAEEVAEDSDRGASMKKHRVHTKRSLSPPVSLIQPLQSHTDMSLQFDQWRTARAQQYPSTTLFQQDQAFSQLETPIPSTPIWTNHYYKPCSQQLLGDLQRRDESMKNVGLDIISHQWKEKSDHMFDLYPENQSTKQKAQETSSFWSSQLQGVRERWAPLPFSASVPLEGFRYKPFFRFSRPSNSQGRSDWQGLSVCARSNTSDNVFYHHC